MCSQFFLYLYLAIYILIKYPYTPLLMKYTAVVNYAPEKGSVEIREIPQPTFGEEDVLLEVG